MRTIIILCILALLLTGCSGIENGTPTPEALTGMQAIEAAEAAA